MNYAKTAANFILLFCLFSIAWTAIPKDVAAVELAEIAAAEINWQKYMQSSANVSAIAAAIAQVDDCSKKPLLIKERKISKGKFFLQFICAGNESEERGVSILFDSFEEGFLFPVKFEYAG